MMTPIEESEKQTRTRKQINSRNRRAGKATERKVAQLLGGTVIPLSGSIKDSVHNLEGDVTVRNVNGEREILKVECKTTSTITPKGDRTFTLKKSVLDQMKAEAEKAGSLGLLYIHWNGKSYENDDYVVWTSAHAVEAVRLMRLGAEYEDILNVQKGEA
jgi:hypothetical protein